jgi:probable DNA metabolism protein
MSGLPVETELIRFARKVIAAAEGRGKAGGDRTAADRRSRDRSDPAVERVLAISAKVCLEIHRLTGLLRFTPAGQGGSADTRPDSGFYAARCAPDYFILPALAEHFRLRFGAVPWIVIDERRSLALTCNGVKSELLLPLTAFALNGEGTGDPPAADPAFPLSAGAATDTWENLWRKYHRSINIETRENPRLQRRFMPVRYWKYLPECNE